MTQIDLNRLVSKLAGAMQAGTGPTCPKRRCNCRPSWERRKFRPRPRRFGSEIFYQTDLPTHLGRTQKMLSLARRIAAPIALSHSRNDGHVMSRQYER